MRQEGEPVMLQVDIINHWHADQRQDGMVDDKDPTMSTPS